MVPEGRIRPCGEGEEAQSTAAGGLDEGAHTAMLPIAGGGHRVGVYHRIGRPWGRNHGHGRELTVRIWWGRAWRAKQTMVESRAL